jgi:hypothetical protein
MLADTMKIERTLGVLADDPVEACRDALTFG